MFIFLGNYFFLVPRPSILQFSKEAMEKFCAMARSKAKQERQAASRKKSELPKGLTAIERELYINSKVDPAEEENYVTLDDLNGCRELKEAIKTNFTDQVIYFCVFNCH